jgi:hypothetical protein
VIWLGARMALAGGLSRLLVTAGAMGFAVALLLGCLGVLPARQAQFDARTLRQPMGSEVDPTSPEGKAADAAAPLRFDPLLSVWRGHDLTGLAMAVTGKPGQLLPPPGLDRLPGPGELALSPALRRALADHPDELSTRLPGRVVATVGDEGLTGPDELIAYVGVTPAELRDGFAGDGFPLTGGWVTRTSRAYVPGNLQIALQLAAVGLLLPVLLLVATAARLSGAARDQRLAAMRLVGATPLQTRQLAAGEQLAAAVLGTAVGLVAFLLLRDPVAGLFPVPAGVFGRDVFPPAWQLLLVLVGVPVLATAVGVLALRRVVTSPLGVRRQARVCRTRWLQLAPLGLGLLLLLAARVDHDNAAGGHAPGVVFLVGGAGLTLIGLGVSAGPLSQLAGGVLARLPGVGSVLAARRITGDPGAAGRVVTGTMLVVFIAGWVLAFLPQLTQSQGSTARDLASVAPGSTLLGSLDNPAQIAQVRALPGVRGVLALHSVQLTVPGAREPGPDTPPELWPATGTIARCADLDALLRRPSGCAGKTAASVRYTGDAAAFNAPLGGVREMRTNPSQPGDRSLGTVDLTGLPEVVLPTDLTGGGSLLGGLLGGILLDSDALPAVTARTPATVVVRTDGRSATTERVRDIGGRLTDLLTLDEQQLRDSREERGYVAATRAGLAVALLVAAASLAVTSADGARERRRGLAALVALGTPLRVLRRALVLQVAAPMLATLGVALGCSVLASKVYVDIVRLDGGYDTPLPWSAWAGASLAAAVAVLLATAATLPLVNAAGRPEALRAE